MTLDEYRKKAFEQNPKVKKEYNKVHKHFKWFRSWADIQMWVYRLFHKKGD